MFILHSNDLKKIAYRELINNHLPHKIICWYDGLSTKLLKLLEPAVTKSLTNQVLTTWVFQDQLKLQR